MTRFLNYHQIGKDRSLYNLDTLVEILGLKVAAGFKTAIDLYGNRLLLCADTEHKVISGQSVLDLMSKIFNEHRTNAREQCIQQIVGLTVMTRYWFDIYSIFS